ncbi:MAG: flavin reductase [Methylococcaceae bacterium]|jgi:flavin reductase (DIM6/NTAB) family NADH-FMN oxidoreductase RutF|nr:MAG: flavin reductase [Methylococcaceae bacterium]
MTVSAEDFKQALQLWGSSVAVVTTHSKTEGNQGMTVTAFSSVSVEPPQILVCLNEKAETGDTIQTTQYFAVNVLTEAQEAVSNEFAGGASQQQRFANVAWQVGTTGVPILSDALMVLECQVVNKVRAGTHWILIAEVVNTVVSTGQPLLYFSGKYRQLT